MFYEKKMIKKLGKFCDIFFDKMDSRIGKFEILWQPELTFIDIVYKWKNQ